MKRIVEHFNQRPYLPFAAFFVLSLSAWLLCLVVAPTTAAIILGAVVASTIDPSVLLAGLSLGLIGKTYKGFAMVAVPISLIISIVLIEAFIKPWLQQIGGGANLGLGIYFIKFYAILFMAHLVAGIRVMIASK